MFLFFSYSQDSYSKYSESDLLCKISFFLNYAIAALVVNYALLPLFYYKRKFYLTFIFFCLIITCVILVDEFFLEKIYFPQTRGAYFPGITFSLVETVPIIIIFVGFKLAFDFNKKQSEIEALKNLVKESELQFLKSQINPHFLFNNLNNLYAYAIESSPKTPSIILELSSVLRYMLYDCKENLVLLKKEIEHLKNFTALNELQIEDRGVINFHTSDNTSTLFYIAPLILNVFIENAFKHSLASQTENINIDISINTSEKGLLVFSCKNNFQTKSNTHNLSKGIGLENVQKRLNLLYPNAHDLKIHDNGYLFNVVLTMQLKLV